MNQHGLPGARWSGRIRSWSPVLLGILSLLLPSPGVAQRPQDPLLGELVHRLSGSFSSQDQARVDSGFSDIRLRMVPIWPDLSPGYWMYVEQAEADTPDRPYRQRVYHITNPESGSFRIDIFALPGDPELYVGAWREEDRLRALQPADLLPREGCGVFLRVDAQGDFVGRTVGRECVSTLRGAAYASSEARIAQDHFENWDRGFDDSGQQVWGSTTGGYVFKVVERWRSSGR